LDTIVKIIDRYLKKNYKDSYVNLVNIVSYQNNTGIAIENFIESKEKYYIKKVFEQNKNKHYYIKANNNEIIKYETQDSLDNLEDIEEITKRLICLKRIDYDLFICLCKYSRKRGICSHIYCFIQDSKKKIIVAKTKGRKAKNIKHWKKVKIR